MKEAGEPASIDAKEKKKKGFEDWEKEGFARDLMRAEEIKGDPEKLVAAHEALQKQHDSMSKAKMSIEKLKSIANNTDMENCDTIACATPRVDQPKKKKKGE